MTSLIVIIILDIAGLIFVLALKRRERREREQWLAFKLILDAKLAEEDERMRVEQRVRFAKYESECAERKAKHEAWLADFRFRMARGEKPRPEDWNACRT